MKLSAAAVALAVASFVAGAMPALHAQETMRAPIAKPLIAARNFLAAGNTAKAMAALRQADAVPGKTPHETAVIDQMRAAIASKSGDSATAAHAYEELLSSGAVSGAEATTVMRNLVSVYYAQHNYTAMVPIVERYLKSGGNDPTMHTLLIQGYYQQGKYAEAARLQSAQIQQRMNDKAGELATIKQLVTYYPKPDYWLNVIDNLRTKPGFSDRLLLDVYRLEFSLGLVNKPADAMDYAELALQAKLPGEAKSVVDKSFAGGLLGTGPEAARHQRLKALVDKSYDSMKAQLGHDDAEAATDRDGNRLLSLGETYVSYGDFAHGLPMMEQAIHKDDLRHPEDAKLQLGLAFWQSGDKKRAIAELRTVGGTEGVADLAQLWILRMTTGKA
jgi:hypothetical protein